MSVLCKLRSGYLENSAFHERACPRSGGKRFPLWFQKLSLGKLLWEGRYYHYPQILCVGDVCSVKTEVGFCWTRELSVKSSRWERFPQWFQTLCLGKLLWEGRFYHYPQILRTNDVCAMKIDLVITRKPSQMREHVKTGLFRSDFKHWAWESYYEKEQFKI